MEICGQVLLESIQEDATGWSVFSITGLSTRGGTMPNDSFPSGGNKIHSDGRLTGHINDQY